MRELGLAATEFGPDGFLPADRAKLADPLASHDLHAVGGFVPVLLRAPDQDPIPEVNRVLDRFVAGGADVVLLRRHRGRPVRLAPGLDDDGWSTLLANLDRLAALARTAVSWPCSTRTSAPWSRGPTTSEGARRLPSGCASRPATS